MKYKNITLLINSLILLLTTTVANCMLIYINNDQPYCIKVHADSSTELTVDYQIGGVQPNNIKWWALQNEKMLYENEGEKSETKELVTSESNGRGIN